MPHSQPVPKVRTYHPLGSVAELRRDPLGFMKRSADQYGDIYSFRTGPMRRIVISRAEWVQHVLHDNARNYRKSQGVRRLKPIFGNGLFLSEGETWFRQRRLAQPAFHRQKLATYAAVMAENAERLIGEWEREGDRPVNLSRDLSALTLRVVSETLFGSDVPEAIELFHRHLPPMLDLGVQRVLSAGLIPLWFPLRDHRRFQQAIRELDELVDRLISERRQSLSESNHDLLSTLMLARDEDTGETMNDRQVRDEVMTFFLAGHETSALAMTWVLFLLARNPAAEERVREELARFGDAVPTMETLGGLSYLKATIQESMRLIPPIWSVAREAIGEDRLGPYRVEPGDNVVVSPFLFHRNEKYWPEPLEFRPERFVGAAAESVTRYAYLPFGAGPRTCIGNHFAMMEMQIVLSMILRRFRLRVDPGFDPGFRFALTLRPGRDIEARLEPAAAGRRD